MKYIGKALIFTLVLCLVSAVFVGCVGPESDDGSNTNGETGKNTTAQVTTAPQTQAPTTNETGSSMMEGVDSVVEDVSDAISGGDSSTTTTEATTTTPRARGMRGRDGK